MLVPSRSKQSRGRMCQLNGGSIYLCLALYSELDELLIGGIYTYYQKFIYLFFTYSLLAVPLLSFWIKLSLHLLDERKFCP